MATTAIARNLTSGASTPLPVRGGQYMVALSGEFDGASVTVNVNIGPATRVPIEGTTYTASTAEILWLPDCTIFIEITGEGPNTKINSAVAELATKFF